MYLVFLYVLDVHVASKLVDLKSRRNMLVQSPRPPQTIGKPVLSKDYSSASQIIFPQIKNEILGTLLPCSEIKF